MFTFRRTFVLPCISALSLAACSAPAGSESPSATSSAIEVDRAGDFVFTQSNAVDGNSVIALARAGGSLEIAGEYATGGLGTGAGLGSQGSVTLSDDGRFLLVVNAGSNDVSSFAVHHRSLELRGRAPSGGEKPTSVAISRHRVVVLNAGGTNNISGLRLGEDGSLTPVDGSARALSAASVGPAQVSFAPDGRSIVVTEKATNILDVFAIDEDDGVSAARTSPSSGQTPFGFGFTPRGELVVSEAVGGHPGASTVSGYSIDDDGALRTLAASVPDHQTAACWIAIGRDGRYAYTANAASDSISGYAVGEHGALTLLDSSASTGAGTHPIDMAIGARGHELYVLGAFSHAVESFSIGEDGSLTAGPSLAGLPATTVGLASR